MKSAALVVASMAFLSARGASAHRLDEYLPATILTVEKDRIQAEIHLTPGVAVSSLVLAEIDTDGDGAISASEQQAYAERVLRDLSLMLDGERLRLHLVSAKFAVIQDMKEGLGEIVMQFAAEVRDARRERKLLFENHHQSRIAAYLVNSLASRDPDIRLTGQNRNYLQSLYQLDYSQSSAGPNAWWSGERGWVGSFGILLLARLALLWRHRRAEAASACRRAAEPVSSTIT